MAVWALVCAILTLFIPFIAGIIALILAAQAARRLRESGGALTGQGLVTAARVVASIGLVINVILAGIVTLAVVRAIQEPDNLATGTGGGGQTTGTTVPGGGNTGSTTPPAGQNTTVLLLEEGDCFLEPEAGVSVGTVQVVDCAQPHHGEVAANVELQDGPYPGDASIDATATQECEVAFQEFIGVAYQDSELGLLYLTPTEETWANGDRIIACVITPYPEDAPPLVGSMRGANR